MNTLLPVQELVGFTVPPINIDISQLPVFGYRKNTINGIAFTSADGNASSGFNYSFGMIKHDNTTAFYDMEFIRKHNILPPYFHTTPTEYYHVVKDCFDQLKTAGLTLFRARLSLIRGNYTIPEHRDTPEDTDYCIKLHIPIQTNPNAKFVFNQDKFTLEKGKAYLANVAKLHSFENNGSEDRYHIIADCIVTNPNLPFYCKNSDSIIKFYNSWNTMLYSDNYSKQLRQDMFT